MVVLRCFAAPTLVASLAGGCTFGSVGGSGEVQVGGSTTTDGSTGVGSTSTTPSTIGGATGGNTTGGASNGSSGATTAVDPSTTGADTTSDGSTGDPGPALVDCGLMSRHYLDEAAEGIMPSQALDAGPHGIDLTLDYGGGNMAYDEVDGHRGLRWDTAASSGGASLPVTGTIFESIDGATTATIEAVVDIDAVSANFSRIVHIGSGSEGGWFTLASEQMDAMHFRQGSTDWGTWPIALGPRERVVVHVVYDTAEADPQDRLRFYADGVRVNGAGPFPDQDAALVLDPTGRTFVIGNRASGQRSIAGLIFYAATYGCALADEEVANNAALLSVDDDTPS